MRESVTTAVNRYQRAEVILPALAARQPVVRVKVAARAQAPLADAIALEYLAADVRGDATDAATEALTLLHGHGRLRCGADGHDATPSVSCASTAGMRYSSTALPFGADRRSTV